MALVIYSDSGSSSSAHDDEAPTSLQISSTRPKPKRKRKRDENEDKPSSTPPSTLPALPSTFHSLYASSVRTTTRDDPTLHSGRTRQIPHIEGNWPTHLYLEWYPSPTELEALTKLIITSTKNPLSDQGRTAKSEYQTIHTLLASPLGAQTPLHISLSAPFVLQTHQRSTFLDSLERAITTSNIKSFTVTTKRLNWASNFDQTRRFLVLRLARPVGDELNKLLGACNGVVARMEQPVLYGNVDKGEDGPGGRETGNLRSGPASRKGKRPPGTLARCSVKHAAIEDRSLYFHISIAWMLQDPGRRGVAAAATAGSNDNDLTQIENQNVMEVPFDAVKVKIGNAVHDIPFAKAASAAAVIKH